MSSRLADRLRPEEKLFWVRLPGGGALRRGILAVQIAGHLLLSGGSILFAVYMPGHVGVRILLGAVLLVSTNAPLVIWSVRRWPEIVGGGDAVFFVTDQRVGALRASGELRQAPLCEELEAEVHAGVVEFRIGGRTPVSFGGLKPEDRRLVQSLVQGLVRRAGAEAEPHQEREEQ